jgi:hypothetical protein
MQRIEKAARSGSLFYFTLTFKQSYPNFIYKIVPIFSNDTHT